MTEKEYAFQQGLIKNLIKRLGETEDLLNRVLNEFSNEVRAGIEDYFFRSLEDNSQYSMLESHLKGINFWSGKPLKEKEED